MAWEIEPCGDLESFAHRFREIIFAAVSLANVQDFDCEVLDESGIPSWFSAVMGSGGNEQIEIPSEVLLGVDNYREIRDENRWDLQEWLFCFDPDLRRWRWWDLTTPDGRVAYLWIDTRGEPVVACEELYWAAFSAGAREVRTVLQPPPESWNSQGSLGIL
ncbi:hypothetical protein ACIPJQ_02875 [Streptomyces griseoviridis]